MADLLQNLSTISFVVAGVCFALAVFFWFFFKIPTVIGDLSGRTARKSIAKMRAANEKTGIKSYKESKTNVERGKLTGDVRNSGKIKNIKSDCVDNGQPETELLDVNKADGLESDVTAILDESTGILESETTGLLTNENATASLDVASQKHFVRSDGKKLDIIEEVIFIHTDEVI